MADMTLNQKSAFGTSLLVFGLMRFGSNIFPLPSGLIVFCGLGEQCPDWVGKHFGLLWQAEATLSVAVTTEGILLHRSASQKLSQTHCLIAFGSAGLVAFSVFWLYGSFPFSNWDTTQPAFPLHLSSGVVQSS
jgi:hypothetical protein